MSKLYLSHITSFSYSNFVVESSNQIILYPYNDANQQVISHSLKITGNPNIYTNFDWYGNKVGFFNYLLPHKNLSIESEAEILVKKVELPKNELNIKESWNQINKLKSESIDFFEFTHCADNANKKAKKALKKMDLKNLSPFELVLKLNKYVYENFKYKKGITKVDTSVDKVWELGLGVCQDFTNVMCSGKVYYDLIEAREKLKNKNVVFIRIEQLYPFPAKTLANVLKRYKKAKFIWCQEEPKNMGAWNTVRNYIDRTLNMIDLKDINVKYVGRQASSTTATGNANKHLAQQKEILEKILKD